MSKHFLVGGFMSLLSMGVFAQTKPTVTTTPKKKTTSVPKPSTISLKNSMDSFYYSIGANIAFNLKEQGIDKVDFDLMNQGMTDAFQNKPLVVSEQQANSCIQKKLQENSVKKLSNEKEKGRLFLAKNGKRKEVTTLPSGLQYEVLKKGDSTSVMAHAQDSVVANYAGSLIDGTEFDNSYKRGTPLTIQVSNVIRGWTEILQHMHIGDKFKVYIPSDLAYGDRGNRGIPGGATLIFEMELLGVKSPANNSVQDVPKPTK